MILLLREETILDLFSCLSVDDTNKFDFKACEARTGLKISAKEAL